MKPRYKTAAQIERLIDRALMRLNTYTLQIEHLEKTPHSRDMVMTLRKRCERIRLQRLPHLKEKLAEFNTMLLPVIGGDDRSVQA